MNTNGRPLADYDGPLRPAQRVLAAYPLLPASPYYQEIIRMVNYWLDTAKNPEELRMIVDDILVQLRYRLAGLHGGPELLDAYRVPTFGPRPDPPVAGRWIDPDPDPE